MDDVKNTPVEPPTLTESLATAIRPIAESRTDEQALTIAAPKVGSVLPVKFYEGASQLAMTDGEKQTLSEAENCPDDEIEIRPDGLIYASHMFYRRALTRIFGAGQWALVPGSDAKPDPQGDRVYRTWVLVVRGCYIGDAVGWAQYFPNNPRANWADSLETTRSDAISKICAKTLGIGANPWDRRYARSWRKANAVQVWVTARGQKEKRWRRIDDEPLEGEERGARKDEVSGSEKMLVPPKAEDIPATKLEASGNSGSPEKRSQSISGGGRAALPPSAAAVASAPPDEPAKATEQMVADNNVRLFMAEARRRKLIVGDDAGKAMEFLVDTLGVNFNPAEHRGKTQIEIMRSLLLGQTWRTFTDKILPKLREVEA